LATPYPGKLVEVLGSGFMAGHHVIGIAVYPLQYIPSSKKLVLYDEIEFSLVFKPSENQAIPVMRKSTNGIKIFSELTKSLVINPQDVSEDINLETSLSLGTDVTEYLIITSIELVPKFQPLADWKTQKGVPAKVIDLFSIYSSYSGVDYAEKVRNCIKDYYQNHGTIWVLLGGDINYVPYRKAFAFTSGEGSYTWEDTIPCDWYFSDLDGSWNNDGDNTWGEYSDGVDLYPDIFVGRASVNNSTKVQTFVNKTLQYEKTLNLAYLDGMLLAGEYLWPGCDAAVLLNYVYSTYVLPDGLFPNPTKLYESLGNLNLTNFTNTLQAGKNFINHCGHGNINIISIGSDYFTNSNADGLTNGNKLGRFYTFACISNAFDFDCLGEHFVNNPNGGTFCYIGNTRYGWGDPTNPLNGSGNSFNREFYSYLFDYNKYHLGQTLASSKLPFIPSAKQQPSGIYDRWTIYSLNLLGDPEMPYLTKTPHNLNITSQPDSIGLGAHSIELYVTDNSLAMPVESALVCLTKGNEVYSRGLTASDGRATLEVSPITPGQIVVTATAQNMVFAQDTITVTFKLGDVNSDDVVDVGDVVYLINYVFYGGPPPKHMPAGDVDCSGEIDISEIVFLINYVFYEGPEPNC
jgi:hypothetical protein